MLIDTFGRRINYLRLSITDRCNLRCSYCMPAHGIEGKRPARDVLSYEELREITQAAVEIGVEKVRITGGEPLVRKGVVPFLAGLSAIAGLKKLVLTTNGMMLEEMARDLKLAGVESINISLDSMRPEVFRKITRVGELSRVLAGVEAAERVFRHVKINVVVMRGVNDEEVLDFAALTLDKPINVRFIEYMPTTRESGWRSLMVSGGEILTRLSHRFRIEKEVRDSLEGPAVNYRIKGAAGKVGFITPISQHFCQSCNRLRVTSSGMVKSCLFEEQTVNLKPYLAAGDQAGLREALAGVARSKPSQHAFLVPGSADSQRFSMSQIGG
ncbi:GTP 3',8-cyclase MoaA [Geomonas azotofigens]|uniref:GTP 3',8-cyclase MoaA n=1 Tax=Geomonas azotofigens TaxID=2843196 RepID=UPI001C0F5864|nr:GTP 3',8-cyclase MoaA [Geomonas azotofigens]MBU5613861.1 GTP 3',8-cyclase MoaA [Geomonas azotofigens]